MRKILLLFLLVFTLCFNGYSVERVAILGDSIAYDGKWAALVESAFRQTPKYQDAMIVNFGLPSETASALSEDGHAGGAFLRPCIHERLPRILDAFKPTLVIACYGINDGIYQPFDEDRFKTYQDGITKLKNDVEQAGASIILITPPLYQPDNLSQSGYDKVLDKYAHWLNGQNWSVVDIRPALKQEIVKERKKNSGFVYAGDGVHPAEAGHRMIATAMWAGIAEILKLEKNVSFPEGEAFAKTLGESNQTKVKWLTETGHSRPQIPGYRPSHVKTVWQSFERHDFTVHGRSAFVIFPSRQAQGKPWIWRTEFFGHEPQADIALIKNGFCAAYIDMQNLYGSPIAMHIMDDFHEYVTRVYGLSDKTVLEGFSRGGLFTFNWAALRPEKVAAIYVDAPVCDFKSWPGGKGKGPGSPDDWKRLQAVYGFQTEQDALDYAGNPVDNLAPLAKARIPIIAVVKVDDTLVPVAENIDIIEQRYRKLGGDINVIRGPGGHHPHSLKNPAPIVDFILNATGTHKTTD